MIFEVAILDVKSILSEEFEMAFNEAQKSIRSQAGYISHQLQKCLENENIARSHSGVQKTNRLSTMEK